MRKDRKALSSHENGTLSYRVKMLNDFIEPYAYNDGLDNLSRHKTCDEYVVHNEKTFRDVLDQFIDAPKKKLTSKDVRADFGSRDRKLSDERVEDIKRYYNGRYDLMKKVNESLSKVDFSRIDRMLPVVMKFNIPLHMSFFSTEDDDNHLDHVAMNEAFIEIEISKTSGD